MDIEDQVLILPYKPPEDQGVQVSDKSLTLQAGKDEIERPWMNDSQETESEPALTPRVILTTISVAGIIPTSSEVITAIEGGYSSYSATPRVGDIVSMTQFDYQVMASTDAAGGAITGNDIYRVVFTVGGTDYTAFQSSARLF